MKKSSTGKHAVRIFAVLVVFLGLFFVGGRAQAATLGTNPSSGSYTVGKTISVRVIVNSSGQSINAVAGAVTFSNDTLTLTGISKSGSIITLWAQEPTYSNSSGTASFQGVTLNGYNGSSGTVVTLTFKAKAEGDATVSLSNANSSVLLNDGQGTNVLTTTSGARFTIGKGATTLPPVVTPPPVVVVPPPVVTEPVVVTPPPAVAPLFTDYQNPLLPGSFVVVKGTGTPNTLVNISLTRVAENGDTTVTQTAVPVLTSGSFIYVSEGKVAEGSSYTLIATGADGQHTQALALTVKNSLSYVILKLLMSIFAIKISAIFVFLLFLLTLYLLYRNRVLRNRLNDRPSAF